MGATWDPRDNFLKFLRFIDFGKLMVEAGETGVSKLLKVAFGLVDEILEIVVCDSC